MAEYERRPERSHRNSKRKRQTNLGDENVEWGCARADSEGRLDEVENKQKPQTPRELCQSHYTYEEETEVGERIPSSPQTEAVPEHPPAGGKCEETAPHLAI